MSDTSKRMELGAHAFFQLGTETAIPNEGNAELATAAQKINEIGMELSEKYGVKWLPSDFKKKNGFKQSVQLSEEHNLYRQNFCGCIFSKKKEEAK